MDFSDKDAEKIEAYEKNSTKNLTVNDALILLAVCAAKEKADINENPVDVANRIAALSKKHPIFSDFEDSIDPAINKFMNMIGTTTDLVNPVKSAAKALKPAHKDIAFSWVTEIIMPDGVLTEERKIILDKYALLLEIDNTLEQKILVEAGS
jgi:hypothetical protein